MEDNNNSVQQIAAYLKNPENPLKARFRALFALRNLNTPEAVKLIGSCFAEETSDLLKHELAYCLGQMQRKEAIPILEGLLRDKSNAAIVRHEAGEALGAIGTDECLQIVSEFTDDDSTEVAETCQIAVSRISYKKMIEDGKVRRPLESTLFFSVDPAYASAEGPLNHQSLLNTAMDPNETLYNRYEAMFQLRNMNTEESVRALASLFKDDSALLRHEVAFILGQMQHEAAKAALVERLADVHESPMVRHEAAEALGAIGNADCQRILHNYKKDPERIVRESVDVALDICEYEMSNEFEYANGKDIIHAVNLPKGGKTDCKA